ncbi:hypothetical protein [Streptomyces heilongjiangensis]|uniref:Restriction endonuclease n=1 Tax=Streptomyces heilongjiangensis TaxID=945052 RepID=A0ABW1BHD4_9ACTN|nr:hypothetical protein [Streptomyces heilongjiangensis]MDC2951247.1 hypothetical protein [Streptomyces heilongjiangensis]
MSVQDDQRENQMVDRFNLEVPEDRKRSDIDAYLTIDGQTVAFELKSATSKGVSTVRDLGPNHFAKWKNIHWIFGVYNRTGTRLLHSYYASPDDMAPWISSKERYIQPDVELAEHAMRGVSVDSVINLFGEKDFYTREEARLIMKNQWSVAQYREAADLAVGKELGYSLDRMVEIMRSRAYYVMSRGATLNNPHIPLSYIEKLPKITTEPAITLRNLVRAYLESTSSTDEATA